MNSHDFSYRIDKADCIVSVSENWQELADENIPCNPPPPENVIGHSLWDFIQDIETRHLYQEIFRRIRAGKDHEPIAIRCDGPEERRFVELSMVSLPDGTLEIQSQTVRTEERPPVNLLDHQTPRSKEFVTLCSMCKQMKVSEDQWVEIEEGLTLLKIFEADEMPQLTHGICPICYHHFMDELEDHPPAGT